MTAGGFVSRILLTAALLAIVALDPSSSQASPVYILNKHAQLVTSSSLLWVRAENGDRPQNSVVGGRNASSSLFVCRSSLSGGGRFHAGYIADNGSTCNVVTGEQTIKLERYQILTNDNGSARLTWRKWRQFSPVGKGAVSVENDVFVARSAAASGESGGDESPLLPGGLYRNQQYGLIVVDADDADQKKRTSGHVLVEQEPVRFEITDFDQGRMRSEKRAEVVMAERAVVRIKSVGEQMFNLTFDRTLYFGRQHNVPTGSPVSLIFANRTTLDFNWGVRNVVSEWRLLRMDVAAAAASAGIAAMTVTGARVQQKLDYTATMKTFFEDGSILTRPIKGVYQSTFFDNFRPVYGQPLKSVPATNPASDKRLEQRKAPPPHNINRTLDHTNKVKAKNNKEEDEVYYQTSTISKSYRYPVDMGPEGRPESPPPFDWPQEITSAAAEVVTAAYCPVLLVCIHVIAASMLRG